MTRCFKHTRNPVCMYLQRNIYTIYCINKFKFTINVALLHEINDRNNFQQIPTYNKRTTHMFHDRSEIHFLIGSKLATDIVSRL